MAPVGGSLVAAVPPGPFCGGRNISIEMDLAREFWDHIDEKWQKALRNKRTTESQWIQLLFERLGAMRVLDMVVREEKTREEHQKVQGG